jgi:hypothetical protein
MRRFVLFLAAVSTAVVPPVSGSRASAQGLRVIRIASGDAFALQSAVSDPANANTLIILERGTYTVTAALALQPNQVLQGPNTYRFASGVPVARDAAGTIFADPSSEAVIDLHLVTNPQGGVVIARGGGVRGITIRDGPSVGALVHITGSVATPGNGFVHQCDLSRGQRSVRVQLNTAAQQGAHAHAVITQSILRDTSGFFSFGYQFQAGAQAQGASLSGIVESNLIRGHRFGGFIAGTVSNAAMQIESRGNVYESNSAGLALHPARDAVAGLGGTSAGVNGNTLHFVTDSDTFRRNGTYPGPIAWPHVGAITAIAAYRTTPAPAVGSHSNNALWLTVRKPVFVDSTGPDLLAYGGLALDGAFPVGQPGPEPAGTHNTLNLTVDLKNRTKPGQLFYCNSIPADPATSNRVNVSGDTTSVVQHCLPLP